MRCGDCNHWDKDEHCLSNDVGSCKHPKIHDMISVGHCDDWDFDKDFGCILFEQRQEKSTQG